MTTQLDCYDYWPFPSNFSQSVLITSEFCYLDYLLRTEFRDVIIQYDNSNCTLSFENDDDLNYLPLFGICLGQCSSVLAQLYPSCACFNCPRPTSHSPTESFHLVVPRAYPPLKEFPYQNPRVLTYYSKIMSEFKQRLYADADFKMLKMNLPLHEINNPNSLFFFRKEVEYFATLWRFFLRRRFLELRWKDMLGK